MKTLDEMFLAHPHAAGESYFQHMRFAWRFAGRLFKASCAAFIHGVLPEAFETTASSAVLEMSEELRVRRAVLAAGKQQAVSGAEALRSA